MKQSAKIIIFILSALMGSLAQSMVSGPIIREETFASGRIDRQVYCWTTDAVAYVSGGVTFTYPVGIFAVAPSVIAQAEVPAPIADTTFITIVSGNSTVGVTITVYKLFSPAGVPTSMVEAASADNITVYVHAIGPQ